MANIEIKDYSNWGYIHCSQYSNFDSLISDLAMDYKACNDLKINNVVDFDVLRGTINGELKNDSSTR